MRRILAKLITALTCVGVLAWLILGSVTASFSDMATTGTSSFTAGTLDLKTNNVNGVTQTLYFIGFIPGESSGSQTITLKNAGTLNGSSLDIDLSYIQEDGTNPPGATGTTTADGVANEIIVTTMTYGGTDLLSGITDTDGDGKDLKEVAAATLTGKSGITAGATKDFVIAIQLKSGLGTAYEADGVNLTMSFTLNQ